MLTYYKPIWDEIEPLVTRLNEPIEEKGTRLAL